MMATTSTKKRQVKVGKVDMKTVLAVLMCLALSAATYFLFTAPTREDAATAKAAVASAQSELDANNKKIDDINTGKQSGAAELLAQAKDLDAKLPADVDKIALVSNVSDLASRDGVTVDQMDPVATPVATGGGNVQSQSFTVSVTGTAEGLETMLQSLNSYPSTLTVSNLTITESGAAPATGAATPAAPAAGAPAGGSTAQFTLKAFYVPSAVVTH